MSAPGPVRAAKATRDDWETPEDLWQRLFDEHLFTLDAAAHESNTKCRSWFGPGGDAEDALVVSGDDVCAARIWCNPPFGKLAPWVEKFAEWGEFAGVVVALLPDSLDTKWAKRVFETAHEIRILHGRVPFVGTTSGNTTGSIIAIWRPGPKPPMPHVWLWDWRADR